MKQSRTKDQVLKRLATAKVKHDREEKKRQADAKRRKYPRAPVNYAPDMKYYTRLHLFKGSNNVFDPVAVKAYSYDWWRYLEVIKGKVVFNNFSYSQQTNGHQSNLKGVLKDLGIKIDVVVHIYRGLQALGSESLTEAYTRLYKTEVDLANGRNGTYAQDHRHLVIKDTLKEIKNQRSLGAKLSAVRIKAIKDEIYNADKEVKAERAARKAFSKNAVKNNDLFNLSVGA